MSSHTIIDALRTKGAKFFANDNIAEFLTDFDLKAMESEVEYHLTNALKALIIDVENDHNTQETAKRIARSWVQEKFNGRYVKPPKITSFPNMGYQSLYTSGPISIRSTCAHHFENIMGNCWVGVVPESEVIGLSKFNRIVHHIAQRPQIQEEMTSQIADALVDYAKTPNIAVVVKCEHHCMIARGVKEHGSEMSTAVMRGFFENDNDGLKSEFYTLIQSHLNRAR